MSSTLTNVLVHAVFSTKNREPVMSEEVRANLHAYIGGIIRGEGGTPIAIGGTADHVHVLMKIAPKTALADMMQKIKGSSSKWVNEQAWFAHRFAWQKGYAAFSVSRSMSARVIRYIEGQVEHHRVSPFKEELLSLLKKHSVEYDVRHIFTE
jgi:REP element-mobilizing transposase RayT